MLTTGDTHLSDMDTDGEAKLTTNKATTALICRKQHVNMASKTNKKQQLHFAHLSCHRRKLC